MIYNVNLILSYYQVWFKETFNRARLWRNANDS